MNHEKVSPVYVSVILPVLNSVNYIKECINSILAQTLKNIEVICIDAGSTDGTLEILKKYALTDPRIRIINSNKRSYGYQLNCGIKEASGKYIGIVDADDYIDPVFFQTLYGYAEKYQFPDFIKSGFLRFMEWENNRFFEIYNRNQLSDIYGKVINFRDNREKGVLDLNHIWSGIYLRKFLLYKDIRLNETFGASYQDLGFSLLVGLLSDTGIFIEENYYYYRTDNAASSVKSFEKWHCVIDEFNFVIHELEKRKLNSRNLKRLVWLQKPTTYLWNLSRLPDREKHLFFNNIQVELLEYEKDPELCMCLNDDQNAALELLKNQKRLKEYFENKEKIISKFKKLSELIKKGEKFVLVSAGTYGKRILLFQDMIHINYIESVADNDLERQGKVWNNYVLLSVAEAVKKHPTDCFLIVNRKSPNTIKDSLVQLGINEKKIFVFHDMLSINDLIHLVN